MAIIDGEMPEPIEQRDWSPRVVVKLRRADAAGRHVDRASAADPRTAVLEALPELLADIAPDARLEPYLDDSDARRISAGRSSRLADYLAIPLTDITESQGQHAASEAAEGIARRLDELDDVETAYVAGGPTPPPVEPSDDPRSANQGYLEAAPDGIDARWAWDRTDGRNVGFVDLEQGWTLDHEDLAGANITVISGMNSAYQGHGTAVLGEVRGVDNARGIVGIAPSAATRVVSQWRSASNYDTAAAILSAADVMSAGDVLLLEAQTTVGSSGFLPVEVEQAVFDAIGAAVDAGIVVVEAAGNGSTDLDQYTDASDRHVLRRGDADFRDSGAIMVGASNPESPHSRSWFSNFGSRIDCFAWGDGIETTGDGWTGTSTTSYTSSFGGTSGASPIVSGAAILLQSFGRRTRRRPFSPLDLRSLLSSSLNTSSANPAADRIGVMPNLRAILENLIDQDRFKIPDDKYREWGYILFGILDDSPGVIWVPGKGPVPVDPGWATIGMKGLDRFAELLAGELVGAVDVQLSPEQVRVATEAAVHGMVQR